MDSWLVLIWICSQAATSIGMCEPLFSQEVVSHDRCISVIQEEVVAFYQSPRRYQALPGPWILHGKCVVEEVYEIITEDAIQKGALK